MLTIFYIFAAFIFKPSLLEIFCILAAIFFFEPSLYAVIGLLALLFGLDKKFGIKAD